MMIVKNILKCYVTDSDIVDLEMIGARLEHHNVKVEVTNMFLCDCGDNWQVELRIDMDERTAMKSYAPSLRRAMTGALEQLIAAQS